MAKKVYRLTILIVTVLAISFIGFSTYVWKVNQVPIGGIDKAYVPTKKYSDEKSITYNKPYSELVKELKYARISVPNIGGSGSKRIRKIEDNQTLIEIVREFDKLKATVPTEEYPEPEKSDTYVLTMWREGTSVSYVIFVHNSIYYYGESDHVLLRKMPKKLVDLLGL